MRNYRHKYFAIPLHDDGREMMGTHGQVKVSGEYRMVAALTGEYVSRDNFVRFTVARYGIVGVQYAIYREFPGPTGWQLMGKANGGEWN